MVIMMMMDGWMAGCKKFNIVYLAGQWVVGPVLGNSYPFVRVGCVVLGNIYFCIYFLRILGGGGGGGGGAQWPL